MMEQYVTLTQAAAMLGVSKATMSSLVHRGVVMVVFTELDTRKKLVAVSDIERLKQVAPQLSKEVSNE